MKSVCILGRQPALGLAELESLYGATHIEPISQLAAQLDIEPKDIDFNRLGGATKLCKLLTYLPTTDLPKIVQYLSDTLPQHLHYLPSGKLHLGLSFYGYGFRPNKINAAALSIKKRLKSSERGVRIIPNKEPELNAAQVLHNQLTGSNGMEIVVIKWGKRSVLAQTTAVQDIEGYARRDQARPMRDARVGMLPPKLAQIIINLAIGQLEDGKSVDATKPSTILDPFCGTGVILQEALLMGYSAYGSDLEDRMVEYSEANLRWLNIENGSWKIEAGDATNHTWQSFGTIAGETYLGRPFSETPSDEVLDQVSRDVDTIHRKFLRNVARQTKPGFRLAIAVPAWKTKNGFKHLKTLDSLEGLGYTRQSFAHAENSDLLYYRKDQVVARELLVLIRK